VSVTYQRGELARVTVEGRLDTQAAVDLDGIFREIARDWPRRLELDLCAVSVYTGEGARAVSDCLMLCRRLDDGVGITVATDAGRRALLESMARV
jgi:hypothetical protein